ncbi:MAG: hypothetical protein KBA33_10125 [Cloacibacterium sp.]|nr:hypothetical protein [Cloacibacterium sp.]
MKNKVSKLKIMKRSILFVLALTLTNCQIEESPAIQTSKIQTISIEEATLFLGQSLNSSSRLSKKGVVKPELGKITQEKINNSDQLLTVIPLPANDKNQNSRILMLKVRGEIKSVVFTMYPEKNILKSEFSGKILIYDLNGNFVNGFRVDNGDIITQFIKNTKKNTTSRSYGETEDLKEVIIINRFTYPKSYTLELAFFSWDCGDGNGGSGDLDLNFTWDSGGGSGGGISNEQAIEDNIDDTELDACTKDVLNKLKNLVNGDITKMLNRFSPPGSIFNIKMSTGQVINPNDWAVTKKTTGSSTDVNMVFNEDYIKGTNNINPPTDLSVATTMAHEIIHAYLISLLEENKVCGASGICDFPTIYDAYIQQQITKDPYTLPDAHHELIAEKYVETIAETIQNFHTSQSVVSGYPFQVYLDMAWGGLQGTYIFNKNYPNDPNHKNYKDRERILDRINAEKKGSQYYSATPIGTPCKK